ncbi:RNA polymerase sigma factor sigA isoform X2 [Rhododendron vialii]|uniref:RNA polymerase sigma factor sigA isoform X2 n=1 Tax=Rhododendron vialii TaxID=182163 RepID=UPI0026605767|nr:RNA polymerase sigma factor sigA isoform X2 [Rhododendron vialii]
MATAAVIGLSAGKRLLSSSFYYSDIAEKLSYGNDYGLGHHQVFSSKKVIMAKKESSDRPSFLSNRRSRSIRALREHADTACDPSTADVGLEKLDRLEEERPSLELSVDALILLQKSMLEKQWNLSTEEVVTDRKLKDTREKIQFACSATSARKRRFDSRKKVVNRNHSTTELGESKQAKTTISPELLRNRPKGYVRGVTSEQLLTHSEVVQLSKLIKIGLLFDERRSRLKERLGCEPLEEQLASSLGISRTELRSKWIESSLALDKLAMSNVRLVMSIAQRYDNMGVEMADLIQGGLIGLIRGIQKFDSSKGCKISTYVYWWIRQGVARAFFENSTTVSLPTHLHERLNLIRGAKLKLKAKGLTPSTETIAACLNMSQQKVRNATEAVTRVFSLDRDAFPSLNGLPGETLHSYIADDRRENDPWVRVYGQTLKDRFV